MLSNPLNGRFSAFAILWFFLLPQQLWAQTIDEIQDQPVWTYGIKATFGIFNFRDSLFVDKDPDPPGNLSDDWAELTIKPWVKFRKESDSSEWFGAVSWAYARTGDDAADISGGGAHSGDFDELYLGWRYGETDSGQIELAGGRYPYQIAHGLLISDGYADGGSRGALWSNPRTAWAPAAVARYLHGGHRLEAFYLERDERPEFDPDTRISGINYQWQSAGEQWTLGASYLKLKANELDKQIDGADVWNFRVYTQPFAFPLTIEAEWAKENNGLALDSTAWYIQPYWTWEDVKWQPTLYYRYAFYEGDNPNTAANEDFDPLFPAFHDWGSWWQGEIAGEYFLSNSNLKTHMLRLRTKPTDNIGTGLLFFDYALDQPGSYQGGVSSSDLGQEVNWFMDWQVSKMFSLNFILAHNNPGKAIEEAFGRKKSFKYAMVYLAFSY